LGVYANGRRARILGVLHVSKGDYLTVNSASLSAVTSESGSNEQLLFTPTLGVGNPFVTSAASDDCTMLIEATVS
jgi:hypothetical protein